MLPMWVFLVTEHGSVKGFTSLNGVITAISVDSGKVLDISILSKRLYQHAGDKGNRCTSLRQIEHSSQAWFEG